MFQVARTKKPHPDVGRGFKGGLCAFCAPQFPRNGSGRRFGGSTSLLNRNGSPLSASLKEIRQVPRRSHVHLQQSTATQLAYAILQLLPIWCFTLRPTCRSVCLLSLDHRRVLTALILNLSRQELVEFIVRQCFNIHQTSSLCCLWCSRQELPFSGEENGRPLKFRQRRRRWWD